MKLNRRFKKFEKKLISRDLMTNSDLIVSRYKTKRSYQNSSKFGPGIKEFPLK